MKSIQNGKPIYDADGNILHAHGGWILPYNGYYYWYGEDRRGENYVSCYRSKNLLDWEFRRHILTTASPAQATRVSAELALTKQTADGAVTKVNIERPKVLWNARTSRFVLWAHYENGSDYHDARCCVASCDTPDGDFIYHGSFNPYGNMSRDCTVWQEPDGRAYFISAARNNQDLHVYRLTPDYLNVEKHVNTLWQGELREAPALFRRKGVYYMLSSYCTGWRPNQGKFGVGTSPEGAWTMLELFGNEDTFRSQPAFVLPYQDGYLYFGDRWSWTDNENLSLENAPEEKLKAYCESTYVILKIQFDEFGQPFIEWQDEFAG